MNREDKTCEIKDFITRGVIYNIEANEIKREDKTSLIKTRHVRKNHK
jgi:hypothetical protein